MATQNEQNRGTGEDEPLLGRAGDASQQDGKPLQFNMVLGRCPQMFAPACKCSQGILSSVFVKIR